MELSADDLNDNLFNGFQLFHIEGYLVQNNDLIQKALMLAKKNNLTTSLDLASFNVVEANKDFLQHLISEYVDIVFANEDEAKAFTGRSPRESLDILSAITDIAVVKLGEQGSIIRSGGEVHEIGVYPVKAIDTTGAGDLYASGFLYGYINELPLDICGRIGALLAANVIEVIGAKMNDEKWNGILKTIREIT